MDDAGRYSFSNFVAALRSPRKFRTEFRRRGLQINGYVHDLLRREPPTDVMEEDWDNLLILDACRYDMFAEQVSLPGRLERRISHGSSSGEFLRGNFADRDCHDTVYVSGNPWIDEVAASFHDAVDLVHDDDTFDFDHRTVRPGTVVREARAAAERYPDKRLIVHFMQPHCPFLGPTGMDLEIDDGFHGNREFDEEFSHVWARLKVRNGKGRERVMQAYRENLDLVIPYVERLLDDLTGRSVVTADHGNLVGNRTGPIPVRGYGHPSGVHVSELVDVPWLTIEGETRREITAETPREWESPSQETIDDRLTDLGYQT
jgi:hypothetical protein